MVVLRVVAALAALVVVALVVTSVLVGRPSATPSPPGPTAAPHPVPPAPVGDPAGAVRRFYAAVIAHDCRVATSLVTPAFLRANGGCTTTRDGVRALAGFSVDVGQAQVSGRSASVAVVQHYRDAAGGEVSDVAATVTVTARRGRWLVGGVQDGAVG